MSYHSFSIVRRSTETPFLSDELLEIIDTTIDARLNNAECPVEVYVRVSPDRLVYERVVVYQSAADMEAFNSFIRTDASFMSFAALFPAYAAQNSIQHLDFFDDAEFDSTGFTKLGGAVKPSEFIKANS